MFRNPVNQFMHLNPLSTVKIFTWTGAERHAWRSRNWRSRGQIVYRRNRRNGARLMQRTLRCALSILESKSQRSRSLGYWRLNIISASYLKHVCNPPMILKLHTLVPHASRVCPIDFEVKRSKEDVNNWFPVTFWDMIMKLHILLAPRGSRMCPIYFGVQRSRSWDIDDWW